MPSIEFDTPTTAEFFTNEPAPAEVVGADPYGDASDATYVKGWSVQDTVTPANSGFHHIYADFAPVTVDGSAITAALRVSVELSGGATDAWFIANFYEAGAVIGTDDPILNLTLGASATYVDTGSSGTPEVLNPTFNDRATDTPATAEQIETYFAGGGFLMIQPSAVGTGNPPSTATVTLHKIDISWAVNNAPCGEKVIKYEVTSQLAQPYAVSPRGPDDDTHHGAFKIAPSRTVSAMVSLASEIGQDFYVQPQVRFLTWDGLGFTVTNNQNLGSAVHLVGDGEWETITRFADADPNATHFYIDFTVASTADGDSPDLGTILYLDCAFIPDNGLDISTEQYLDGTVVANLLGDGCWEGPAHNSTSIYCPEPEEEEEIPPPPEGGDEDSGEGEPPVDVDDDPPFDPGTEPPVEEPVPTTTEVATAILTGTPPAGLCLGADIQLGEHLFNTVDEYGVLWLVSDIEGWWTLPEPDIPDFPKGIDDGSYETRGRYAARVFTVTGSFFPNGSGGVRAARDRLIRAANLCHYGAWFGTHESDATRASKVWLSGQPSISTINTSGRTDFSIGLKAPDPIKYGIPNGMLTDPGYEMTDPMISKNPVGVFGRTYPREYVEGSWSYMGDVEAPADETLAINAGNVRVYPTILIDGPTFGPIRIYNDTTKQMMRVQQGTTQLANQVVIDCFNRTVTFQDNLQAPVLRNQRFRLDTLTDWIYLNPGSNRIYFTEETGGGLAKITVSWRSGWIG